jgi:biofilm PGA synthesis lipoprotein PgaB
MVINTPTIKKNQFPLKSSQSPARGMTSRRMRLNQAAFGSPIYYSGKTVVLTYHNISETSKGDITITPERFESDLKMLKDNGFNVIGMRQMLEAMDGKGIMPDNAVVISFDDGIGSFYKYAFPLLKKYNLPAVNFLITSRNETYSSFAEGDRPLSPQEISEMYLSGLIDIQSHTNQSHEYVYINSELKKGAKLTHRMYDKETGTMESEEEYEARVADDLTKSRNIIYKYTRNYPDTLCFPFGLYNDKVIEIAKKCGYNYFVTTLMGTNKENSESNKILRIRSGDEKLSTDKLFNNIMEITVNKKAR